MLYHSTRSLSHSVDSAQAVLEGLGYDSNLRGETLSMEEFSEIAKRFTK